MHCCRHQFVEMKYVLLLGLGGGEGGGRGYPVYTVHCAWCVSEHVLCAYVCFCLCIMRECVCACTHSLCMHV